MLVTVVTASYDEIHQTFIPSRTGGGRTLFLTLAEPPWVQLMVYFLSAHALKLRRTVVRQPN